ncbi:hypothetical protein [Tenacibaculum caenipelagi]|uniref:Uncharacterized protein n=1 Tax=Tenacibaculum caenipelagi TaxID=1325435 RepID=A0A4R6T9R3_9FLAO|nr:hypothetical protein [Tenacibaculum caenipelagi]TDQ22746.1 hypothetical protein DFQ07_2764 [Tenacibaculum caenipelagi]
MVINQKSEVKTLEVKAKDSIYLKVTSLPIEDTFFIGLKTNNKVVDSIINLKLSGFSTSKSSGKNKYSAKYDSIKKGFEISTTVQGSSDTEKHTNTNTIKNTESKESKDKSSEIVKGVGFNWWWFVFCLVIAVLIAFKIWSKFF